MILEEYFHLLLNDYTLQVITLGTATLGALCGMLGTFAVLRKQSLLGDAISHAALPGIVIAYLLTHSKNSGVLLLGALVSGLLGVLWIRGIIKKTHLKTDTALGLILSLFFGIGILLLTFVQKTSDANQAGLDKYLFGQAATLLKQDVILLIVTIGLSLMVIFLFWKEFKIVLFDEEYAKTLGFNTKIIDFLISTFIVVAIVLGLQTVGVVLMSAMLLAPAAAARQWTNKLWKMLFISAIFGALSGVIGTGISSSYNNLSTGPVIVLVTSFFVMISFVFSPIRGLLFKQIKLMQNRNDLQLHKTLSFMYEIAKNHEDITHPHTIKILNNFKGFSKKSLKKMVEKEWIILRNNDWSLTPLGFETAKNLYNQNIENNE